MKKETNNILIISFISILVLFILVFFNIYFNLNNSNSIETNYKPITEDLSLSFQDAIESNDISNCDHIVETNLIESCKLELVNCLDDDCYFDKARYEMNEQLCFNIEDGDKRAGCSASIKISDIKQRSVLEDNIEICNEFGTEETINFCRDNYYIASRYNKNNLSFCDKIKNEVIKNECFK